MDILSFMIFLGALIAHLYSVQMTDISFIGVCIGIGLCAIAGAIHSLGRK